MHSFTQKSRSAGIRDQVDRSTLGCQLVFNGGMETVSMTWNKVRITRGKNYLIVAKIFGGIDRGAVASAVCQILHQSVRPLSVRYQGPGVNHD